MSRKIDQEARAKAKSQMINFKPKRREARAKTKEKIWTMNHKSNRRGGLKTRSTRNQEKTRENLIQAKKSCRLKNQGAKVERIRKA